MPEDNKAGSAIAGSPDLNKVDPANAGQSAEGTQATEAFEKATKQNEELEKKLGQQGQELGDYRDFVKNITPLLNKLDEQPDLIQAILDGKINQDLVKAALDGKISVKDAKEVSDAHDKVKKTMGKDYEGASAEDVENRIKAELDKRSEEFDKKLAETEELRDFKQSVQQFIDNTPDFAEYSDGIAKFLDEHPNIDDIGIAYDAVKGRTLSEKMKANDDKTAAERAKDLAANAGGGSSLAGTLVEDKDVIDRLISSKSNPNAV